MAGEAEDACPARTGWPVWMVAAVTQNAMTSGTMAQLATRRPLGVPMMSYLGCAGDFQRARTGIWNIKSETIYRLGQDGIEAFWGWGLSRGKTGEKG